MEAMNTPVTPVAPEWKRNDKTLLANAVGISRQFLNEVLQRRSRVTTRILADQLETEAFRLGYCIPWDAWMLPTETDNPYFADK